MFTKAVIHLHTFTPLTHTQSCHYTASQVHTYHKDTPQVNTLICSHCFTHIHTVSQVYTIIHFISAYVKNALHTATCSQTNGHTHTRNTHQVNTLFVPNTHTPCVFAVVVYAQRCVLVLLRGVYLYSPA